MSYRFFSKIEFMLKIGLTGGIGSGKTTVAKIFETLGIPVYYADDEAKRIMNEDEVLKQSIIESFGPSSYINGTLNRAFISGQVFDNPAKLAQLNALVHPATIRDSLDWIQRQHAPYVIKEAALIFESGMELQLDYVIGVSAPKDLRIMRSMNRDGLKREEVLKRMENQMNEEKKIGLCNFVITNDEKQAVLPQVLSLHQVLLTL
jgi:dephospho-CoA kinase